METGRDEYITFLLKALAGGRGRAFPNCSWLEQEALVRHVWAEVILDVSHTPAGQLVLGQVKAKAAQLENCGLGFRSLQEAQYMLWWSVSSRLRRLLINSVQRRRQRKGSPVSAVCPWRETQTDLGCSWPSQPCLYDPKRASTASRSLRDEIQTWPVGSEDVFQARCVLARVGKRDAKCQSLTWTGRKGSSSAPFHLENSRQTIFSISLRGQRMKSISCVQPITSCSSRQAKTMLRTHVHQLHEGPGSILHHLPFALTGIVEHAVAQHLFAGVLWNSRESSWNREHLAGCFLRNCWSSLAPLQQLRKVQTSSSVETYKDKSWAADTISNI